MICGTLGVDLILLPPSPCSNICPEVSSLSGIRDQFYGRQFFHGPGKRGLFRDDSSPLHLSCTYFISVDIASASLQITRNKILEVGECRVKALFAVME